MTTVCVAGIGTLVGKTLVSAILCEKLQANYWKPVASGIDDGALDVQFVRGMMESGDGRIIPTSYVLREPLSPHAAARMEGISIEIARLALPTTASPLVVELAGGLMVPLNDSFTNLDLVSSWKIPIVLVSRHYLGSINHTLLSIHAARTAGIEIVGVVFNGSELPDTERIITRMGDVPVLGRIPELKRIDRSTIQDIAKTIEWPE